MKRACPLRGEVGAFALTFLLASATEPPGPVAEDHVDPHHAEREGERQLEQVTTDVDYVVHEAREAGRGNEGPAEQEHDQGSEEPAGTVEDVVENLAHGYVGVGWSSCILSYIRVFVNT